jgi:hypothetical protein
MHQLARYMGHVQLDLGYFWEFFTSAIEGIGISEYPTLLDRAIIDEWKLDHTLRFALR